MSIHSLLSGCSALFSFFSMRYSAFVLGERRGGGFHCARARIRIGVVAFLSGDCVKPS